MTPQEKNDLKAENEALQLTIKESQETLEELRRIFDNLTARNKQLEAAQRLQGTPPSHPTTETVKEQDPTPAPAIPAPSPAAPQSPNRVPHISLHPLEKCNGVVTSVIEWLMTSLILVSLHGMMEASEILKLPFYVAGIARHLNQDSKVTLRTLERTFYKNVKPTKPVYKEVLRRQQERCTETSLAISASFNSINNPQSMCPVFKMCANSEILQCICIKDYRYLLDFTLKGRFLQWNCAHSDHIHKF